MRSLAVSRRTICVSEIWTPRASITAIGLRFTNLMEFDNCKTYARYSGVTISVDTDCSLSFLAHSYEIMEFDTSHGLFDSKTRSISKEPPSEPVPDVPEYTGYNHTSWLQSIFSHDMCRLNDISVPKKTPAETVPDISQVPYQLIHTSFLFPGSFSRNHVDWYVAWHALS